MATYNAKKLTLVNQNGDVYVIDPLQGNESVYLDLPVTIAQNQWSGTAPYTYTYTNSHITANAALCVYFKDGVREGLVGDLKWSKATGSITFVTTEPAAGPVPLVVRVIDSTTNGVYPVDAEIVETDAIVGETTVQGALEDLDSRITSIWETIYPVGSIYMSVTSTSPGTLFGGTWERLKSRFLLGAEDSGDTTGDPYIGEATGGAKSQSYTPAGTNTGCAVTDHTYTPAGTNSGGAVQNHTLTAAEMPKHNHSFTGSAVTSGGISANHTHTGTSGNQSANHTHTGPSHTHQQKGYMSVPDTGGAKFLVSWRSTDDDSGGPYTRAAGTGATGSNSANHTHTTTTGNQSVGHTHSVTASGTIGDKGSGGAHSHGFTQPTFTGTQATLSHTVTQPTFTGTASTIDTMPPYLSVYMWKRTA